MQKTCIVITSHRGLEDETADCLNALNCPSIIKLKGLANLDKARSIAFDKAFQGTEGTPVDTILSLDDDMLFAPESAQALVEASRQTGELCSAVYLTAQGTVAARAIPVEVEIPGAPIRWLVGLGALAIPRRKMAEIRPMLREIGGIPAWCQTGNHPSFDGEWLNEDYWFCHSLGGALLVPVAFGHLKKLPIWPDGRMLRSVADPRAQYLNAHEKRSPGGIILRG